MATDAKPKPTHRHSLEPDANQDSAVLAKVDVPTGYVAAVERLRECTGAIKDALATGAKARARRPLDEAEVVTAEIMVIARDSGVPKCSWDEVHAAQRLLRATLEKLHAAIDAGQQPDLPANSQAIESSLQHMESVAARLY